MRMKRKKKRKQARRRRKSASLYFAPISASIELLRKHVDDLISKLIPMKIAIGIFIGLIPEHSLLECKKWGLTREPITTQECQLWHTRITLEDI